VIFADEPTGALDSRSSMELMQLFQELGRTGITIVLVTHEPDIGRCAERVVMVKDGKIVSDSRQVPMLARPEETGSNASGPVPLPAATVSLPSGQMREAGA
jgi:putative ABC transport system ATP-binding protein